MNLSLKNRLMLSFLLVCLSVIVIGVVSFAHLAKLDRTISNIISTSEHNFDLGLEIENDIMIIYKMQTNATFNATVDENQLQVITTSLLGKINIIREQYTEDISALEFLDLFIARITTFSSVVKSEDPDSSQKNSELLLDAYMEFKKIQKNQTDLWNSEVRNLINTSSKNMLTILTISFFICILLCLVIPAKVALPFKKVKDAIKELQECNFDVSIYYAQDDEVGELAREINKMIAGLKSFEELRADRILVENRKFDALANLTDLYVLVTKANSEIIYLNNLSYSLLQIQSEAVIGKQLEEGALPDSIIDIYKTAIKRRAKIDEEDVSFPIRENDGKDGIFTGMATVIPIRGKDSSQDYYLMVMTAKTPDVTVEDVEDDEDSQNS